MHLDAILAATAQRLTLLRAQEAAISERALSAQPAHDVLTGFRGAGTPVLIAEFKRRSPSRGDIAPDGDALAVGRAYASLGADAISCLTEPEFFAGRNRDLCALRDGLPAMPLLRKDFILDPLQVREARALGADICLLIVRVLGQKLGACLEEARARGITALVEVHDERELDQALTSGAELIGVNNRDLESFTVDLSVGERLLPQVPEGVFAIAESGLRERSDVRRMLDAGARGLLIGETLMRAGSLAETFGALGLKP